MWQKERKNWLRATPAGEGGGESDGTFKSGTHYCALWTAASPLIAPRRIDR